MSAKRAVVRVGERVPELCLEKIPEQENSDGIIIKLYCTHQHGTLFEENRNPARDTMIAAVSASLDERRWLLRGEEQQRTGPWRRCRPECQSDVMIASLFTHTQHSFTKQHSFATLERIVAEQCSSIA